MNKRKKRNFWTKKKCIEVAKKSKNRSFFKKNYNGAWYSSKKNDWIDEVFTYLPEDKRYVWTKDMCLNEALKYKYRFEFKFNSAGAYNASVRNKWLDEVCLHMQYKQLPNGYWSDNKLKCFDEGIKYKNINQFKLNCAGAYNAIIKNRWYSEFKIYKQYNT